METQERREGNEAKGHEGPRRDGLLLLYSVKKIGVNGRFGTLFVRSKKVGGEEPTERDRPAVRYTNREAELISCERGVMRQQHVKGYSGPSILLRLGSL